MVEDLVVDTEIAMKKMITKDAVVMKSMVEDLVAEITRDTEIVMKKMTTKDAVVMNAMVEDLVAEITGDTEIVMKKMITKGAVVMEVMEATAAVIEAVPDTAAKLCLFQNRSFTNLWYSDTHEAKQARQSN